jgi:hypothetical protein
MLPSVPNKLIIFSYKRVEVLRANIGGVVDNHCQSV